MSFLEVMSRLSAAGFLTFVGLPVNRSQQSPVHWRLPAALSLALLVWSPEAVIVQGPIGFWPLLSQSLWGNQFWFYLLLAFGLASAFWCPELVNRACA